MDSAMVASIGRKTSPWIGRSRGPPRATDRVPVSRVRTPRMIAQEGFIGPEQFTVVENHRVEPDSQIRKRANTRRTNR